MTEENAIDIIVNAIPTIDISMLLGNCFIIVNRFISNPASKRIISRANEAKRGEIEMKIDLSRRLKTGPIKNPNKRSHITSGICVFLKIMDDV
jgi:hypothetical protein